MTTTDMHKPFDIVEHPWDELEEIVMRRTPPVPEKCWGGHDHIFIRDADMTFLQSCVRCGAFYHTWARLWRIPE